MDYLRSSQGEEVVPIRCSPKVSIGVYYLFIFRLKVTRSLEAHQRICVADARACHGCHHLHRRRVRQ